MDAGRFNRYRTFLIPNVQMNIGGSNISLIKMYPHRMDEQITDAYRFLLPPEMIELAASVRDNSEIQVVDASNVYDEMDPDMAPGEEVAFTLKQLPRCYSGTIADKTMMGEQRRQLRKVVYCPTFGLVVTSPRSTTITTRSEALGMPPLDPVSVAD